jgi:hypothetical protein
MARYKLDTGNSGDYEILEGETRADVLQDVLNHHEIDELPEGWTLEEIEPKNRHAVTTNRATTDGLTIYDLDPLSAELWAIAGPAGHDPKAIDTDDLPDGFRWITTEEWEELQSEEDRTEGTGNDFSIMWQFMGRLSKDGFQAAEAVSIAMQELKVDRVTKDVLHTAAATLGGTWDAESVEACIKNCSFEKIAK